MNKKFLSIIMILCTVICVSVMIFGSYMGQKHLSEQPKVEVMKSTEKEINKDTEKVGNVTKHIGKVETDVTSDKEEKRQSVNTSVKLPGYKIMKSEISYQLLKEDCQNYYETKYGVNIVKKTNGNQDEMKEQEKNQISMQNKKKLHDAIDLENSKDNENEDKLTNGELQQKGAEEEVAVFKPIKKEEKNTLTVSEKEKLLLLGRKLSAVDYSKIKEYIESDKMDIVKALELLKSKLTDKEYFKIEEIAKRFANAKK